MSGLIDLDRLYFPTDAIDWPEAWWPLNDDPEFQRRLQQVLNAELSEKHPLWGLQPVVIAKESDDLIVHLNNQQYALVHIVGSGKVDQYPHKYPSFQCFESLSDLQQFLNDYF